MSEKIQPQHLARKAMLYVRQSSAFQVAHNLESGKLQYAMQTRLRDLGFAEIEVIDEDLGRSAAGTVTRSGFERMVAEVVSGRVGAVAAREVSRFARNSREWQQLVEVCRIVDTVLIDQEMVYAPRASNDRLLLGLKGSLNEYELDLLRQRSLEARRAKAKRGELIVSGTGRVSQDRGASIREGPRPARARGDPAGVRSVRADRLGAADVAVVSRARLELPAVLRAGRFAGSGRSTAPCTSMLTNPVYGGAYAYGKTERGTRYEGEARRKSDRRKPRDQWLALIPKRTKATLSGSVTSASSRRSREQFAHSLGLSSWPARDGRAILSGLLRCRRCASKLTVHYTGQRRDVATLCLSSRMAR